MVMVIVIVIVIVLQQQHGAREEAAEVARLQRPEQVERVPPPLRDNNN